MWHLFLLSKLLRVTLLNRVNTTTGWNYFTTRSSTSSFDNVVPSLLTIKIDKNVPSSMSSLIDRFQSYAKKDLTKCLDSMERNKNLTTNRIHLAFIGDSRIRNQFVNFIQVNLFTFNFLTVQLFS